MSRLPHGGRIDRSRTLSFSFDGVRYTGHPGDTLASALLANDVHLMGRSFKYHRPRGVLGSGVEEPNALFGVTRGPGRFEPNQRATCVPLVDSLVVESQNRWPGLARDLGALNDMGAAFIPAGFYYKTFMWPPSAWHRLYEPRIRAMAGLGRPTTEPDPDRYAQRWAHCEVLVVGAGPAGLAAALAAAAGGGRVILCDQDEEIGGSLLAAPEVTIDGARAWDWLAATRAMLEAAPNVTLLPRTTAIAYGIHNLVTLAQRRTDHLAVDGGVAPGAGARERQWQVRAARVVIATGATERPLVFPNNDRPGIMLASAARAYATRWGVEVGSRVAVAADHDSGWRAAFDMADAGIGIVALVDSRAQPAAALTAEAAARGIEVIAGHVPADTRGRLRVTALGIAPAAETVATPTRWIDCDAVAMAGGWTPSLHLFSQSRGRPRWDDALGSFVPGASAQAEISVGACSGSFGLAEALSQGWAACGGTGAPPQAASTSDTGASVTRRHAEGSRRRAWVDFQNDVTAKDLRLALREGFQSIEHLKRYTTTGMATDQGRTSNVNALAIAAQQLGVAIPEVGLTTFRAPFTPATFAGFAAYGRGTLFDPVRKTPMHDDAVAAGAVFEDVGQWKRARYFPRAGEDMDAAVARECAAVRTAAGLFDASTLGKIAVVGPDAADFLDFLYTNPMRKLGVGRCRYGVMLREDGFIWDDGIVARLADDSFHVTTTTGGAANVLGHMEDYRQTELPHLKVWLTSITEQYAVAVVGGPNARAVLEPLVEGVDLSTAAFPHLSVRDCMVAGIPARLFRVSFSGETAYEINVAASQGRELWAALAHLTPYGTEAMHVLRAEKGFIIVGQDTDGTVTPDDAGLGWAVGKAKGDFVGLRSLLRPAMLQPDRKQLIGLVPVDGATLVEEGAQLVDAAAPRTAIGHVSSSYRSGAVGGPIALALLRGGRARIGGAVEIAHEAGNIPMRVVAPIFYDPDGSRMNG